MTLKYSVQSFSVTECWEHLEKVSSETAKAGAAAFEAGEVERAAWAAARIKTIEGYLDRALKELDRGLAAGAADGATER